ncbi:MAG: hypothetical protein V8R80_00100 [Eubacterium sp.]
MQGQLQEEIEAANLLLKEKKSSCPAYRPESAMLKMKLPDIRLRLKLRTRSFRKILAAEERARQLAAQKAAEEQKKKEESEKKQESEQEEESEKQEEAGKDESPNSNVDTDNS